MVLTINNDDLIILKHGGICNGWLVVLTILKNVSPREGFSHIMEDKKCLKPPTRWGSTGDIIGLPEGTSPFSPLPWSSLHLRHDNEASATK